MLYLFFVTIESFFQTRKHVNNARIFFFHIKKLTFDPISGLRVKLVSNSNIY
jgi:hypothetical protein